MASTPPPGDPAPATGYDIPPGKNLRLSLGRRIICDLMHHSRRVPLVSIERTLELGPLIAARKALAQRPAWYALMMKAYSAVSARMPVLRRAYMAFPLPHLHEHACTVGNVPIERDVDGEPTLIFLQIVDPEKIPIMDLDRHIREAKTLPIHKVGAFAWIYWSMLWCPRFLRIWAGWWILNAIPAWRARIFGTFGLTGVAGLGATSVHFLSPLTTSIAFGVIDDKGRTLVRMMFDHRVVDGTLTATALEEFEKELNGPIAAELLALALNERRV